MAARGEDHPKPKNKLKKMRSPPEGHPWSNADSHPAALSPTDVCTLHLAYRGPPLRAEHELIENSAVSSFEEQDDDTLDGNDVNCDSEPVSLPYVALDYK